MDFSIFLYSLLVVKLGTVISYYSFFENHAWRQKRVLCVKMRNCSKLLMDLSRCNI